MATKLHIELTIDPTVASEISEELSEEVRLFLDRMIERPEVLFYQASTLVHFPKMFTKSGESNDTH